MILYALDSLDTASNLAVEECLFRRRPPQEAFLLYRNSPSVLCGRNQLLTAECDVAYCRSQGIGLFRRISGGGTVYHDAGNLNFGFLVPRKDYAPDKYLAVLPAALARLGVDGFAYDKRYSLKRDGFKLAGSAFALSGGTALLHVCTLVSTDLLRLERVLTPNGSQVQGGLVASVPSPVTSLFSLNPSLTVQSLADSLFAEVDSRFGIDGEGVLPTPEEIRPYREKFLSEAWTFREDRNS
jgi:lipoate-protein ligase A